MRIVVANDGIDDAGGVTTYLRAVCSTLQKRGHAIHWLHCAAEASSHDVPASDRWSVASLGHERAISSVSRWQPDACFSHNMRALEVERALLGLAPVVKMMHGYLGTCVSGLKSFAWPERQPCSRVLGPACLALYLPRRCGRLHPGVMVEQYRLAIEQRSLFPRYNSIVVASDHMKTEYVRCGAPADRVRCIPLFAPPIAHPRSRPSVDGEVVFIGRMTSAKGGDLLVRAIAEVARLSNRRVPLVMAGDGPERARWESLTRELSVAATFPGWIDRDTQRALFARASLLAVPSTWPEPFGLVGLEAAACGVPAVAFDVGGIREWLRDNESGLFAGTSPDVTALAAAIERVLEDRALHARLSDGAYRMARTLTVEHHVDALERVLESARTAVAAHT